MDIRLLFLIATTYFSATYGLQRNIMVEDQSSSISYSGSWSEVSDGTGVQWDSGGSHMVTNVSTATASFTFTGVAIYYMSPLWPYNVNTVVSVDGGSSTVIDLVDHSGQTSTDGSPTVKSAVVWASGPLSNTQHTLRISVGSSNFGVVDALIYTTDDSVSSPLLSSTTSSSSSTTPTSSSTSSSLSISSAGLTSSSKDSTSFTTRTSTDAQGSPTTIVISTTSIVSQSSTSSKKLPVILGAAIGVLVLALIIVLVIFFICRRRRNRSMSSSLVGVQGPPYVDPKGAPPHMHQIGENTGMQHAAVQPYMQDYSSGFSDQGAWRPEVSHFMPPPMIAGIGSTRPQGNFNYETHDPYQAAPPSSSQLPRYPPRPFSTTSEITSSPSSLERTSHPSEFGNSIYASNNGGIDSSSAASGSHPGSSHQKFYSDKKEHLPVRLAYNGDIQSLQNSPPGTSASQAGSYQQQYNDQKELLRVSATEVQSSHVPGPVAVAPPAYTE